VVPGETELTLIPYLPSSRAKFLDNPMMPPLAAEYVQEEKY